jgi:multicomponent Na+:H+ antiporter subunit E
MAKKITLFIYTYTIWSLLNWVPDWEHLTVGIFVAALVTYITGDLFAYSPKLYKDPRRLLKFVFFYLPMMFFWMIKASLKVAYRILHPDLPVRPGIVKVKISLKTDTALTYLCNTITLTGGTMVVDIDRDDGVLYVHCVDVLDQDIDQATKHIVGRFEPILMRIFE